VRRFFLYGLPFCNILFFLALFLVQGCTSSVLQIYPASEKEIGAAYESFRLYREVNEDMCGCCLDAEVEAELTISGWFNDHVGKLSGYLQAMKPGYIRFVALNPLGQPLYIFLTDGSKFTSLNVYAEKAYSGSVDSRTYKKIVPSGFDPEFAYYWLNGRLPPQDMQIADVMRAGQPDAYWLQIRHDNVGTERMILFDAAKLRILRHVLRDEKGSHLVDISYRDYEPLNAPEKINFEKDHAVSDVSDAGTDGCSVPGKITIASHGGSEKISVKLHSFLPDASFSEEDFRVNIPDSFEQMLVR